MQGARAASCGRMRSCRRVRLPQGTMGDGDGDGGRGRRERKRGPEQKKVDGGETGKEGGSGNGETGQRGIYLEGTERGRTTWLPSRDHSSSFAAESDSQSLVAYSSLLPWTAIPLSSPSSDAPLCVATCPRRQRSLARRAVCSSRLPRRRLDWRERRFDHGRVVDTQSHGCNPGNTPDARAVTRGLCRHQAAWADCLR